MKLISSIIIFQLILLIIPSCEFEFAVEGKGSSDKECILTDKPFIRAEYKPRTCLPGKTCDNAFQKPMCHYSDFSCPAHLKLLQTPTEKSMCATDDDCPRLRNQVAQCEIVNKKNPSYGICCYGLKCPLNSILVGDQPKYCRHVDQCSNPDEESRENVENFCSIEYGSNLGICCQQPKPLVKHLCPINYSKIDDEMFCETAADCDQLDQRKVLCYFSKKHRKRRGRKFGICCYRMTKAEQSFFFQNPKFEWKRRKIAKKTKELKKLGPFVIDQRENPLADRCWSQKPNRNFIEVFCRNDIDCQLNNGQVGYCEPVTGKCCETRKKCPNGDLLHLQPKATIWRLVTLKGDYLYSLESQNIQRIGGMQIFRRIRFLNKTNSTFELTNVVVVLSNLTTTHGRFVPILDFHYYERHQACHNGRVLVRERCCKPAQPAEPPTCSDIYVDPKMIGFYCDLELNQLVEFPNYHKFQQKSICGIERDVEMRCPMNEECVRTTPLRMNCISRNETQRETMNRASADVFHTVFIFGLAIALHFLWRVADWCSVELEKRLLLL